MKAESVCASKDCATVQLFHGLGESLSARSFRHHNRSGCLSVSLSLSLSLFPLSFSLSLSLSLSLSFVGSLSLFISFPFPLFSFFPSCLPSSLRPSFCPSFFLPPSFLPADQVETVEFVLSLSLSINYISFPFGSLLCCLFFFCSFAVSLLQQPQKVRAQLAPLGDVAQARGDVLSFLSSPRCNAAKTNQCCKCLS